MPVEVVTETQLRKRLTALNHIRRLFRDSMAAPLKRSMLARSPLATASRVWELPVEAAAAGFELTMLQSESGWSITLTRAIDDDTVIHTAGEAQSLLKAIFQLVDATQQQIEVLEAESRHQLNRIESAAQIAA